jgi:hypothetical protein
MDIPLVVVKKNKTHEYLVCMHKKLEISEARNELYNKMAELNDQMRERWVYTAGNNYAFIHPAEMKWSEVLSMQEMIKEMVELKAKYIELSYKYEEQEDIRLELLDKERKETYKI